MSGQGDGLFGVLLYSGGVVSRKRGWFKQPTPSRLLIPSVVCVAVTVVVVTVMAIILFGPDMPLEYLMQEPSSAAVVPAVYMFVLIVLTGPYALAFTVCCFTFSRKFCNCTNKFWSFLAGGSFAVYLIHWIVIVPFFWSYVVFLREVQGINVTFVDSTTSNTVLSSGDVVLGFFWVSILSVIACLAIGGGLKKIPGFGKYI